MSLRESAEEKFQGEDREEVWGDENRGQTNNVRKWELVNDPTWESCSRRSIVAGLEGWEWNTGFSTGPEPSLGLCKLGDSIYCNK